MDRTKKSQQKELKYSLNRFLKSAGEALTDLTTLEVNSVLVHNISADHPSNDRVFLNQICEDLVDWFQRNRMEGPIQKPLSKMSLEQLTKLSDKGELLNEDEKDVEDLRVDVSDCLSHEAELKDHVQRHKRSEYRRRLRYLEKYLELHRSPNWNWSEKLLEGRERGQLRKLWEMVATDFVYAQTVVSLDGDVVSRVNQRLFDTAEKAAEENAEELIGFHRRNVEAGTSYRNNLIETFVSIIRTVLGRS